jgi:hypothetical protein
MTQNTSYPRFVGDGNTQGTVLGTGAGQSPAGKDSAGNAEKVALYGNTTPVAQRSGAPQAAVTRGQQAGVIATYSTTQSPSAVAANTSAEKSMTVQSGTGFTMQLATGDLLYVNKPTAQAGLGMGNARVSGANTAAVTFSNFTVGSITPTGSEVYTIVALRGLPNVAAVLSPAAVAANSTVEQQFTVTGLVAGQLVQVVKPTSQAGLDIAGCRVVSNNTLGITFANVTAAPITPTAAESYTVLCLAGLDAVNNEIAYGMNVGTVGAIGAGVVASGGSTTLTGVLASDICTGVYKPTNGAAATNAAAVVGAVLAANSCTPYFVGIGTGATPTASEVYGVKTMRANPAAPLLLYTPTLTPAAVAANTTAEQTFTVTGLVAGSPVWVNKAASVQGGLGIVGCRVSAANTLAITFSNSSGSSITPNSEQYLVGNFQVPAPGAGNSVYQSALPWANNVANLSNEIRSALVALGAIVGA